MYYLNLNYDMQKKIETEFVEFWSNFMELDVVCVIIWWINRIEKLDKILFVQFRVT